MLEDPITLFHFDEFYHSLQNTSHYYLTMDNGVRFQVIEGFYQCAAGYDRYNNRPAPGTGDTDNLYLITLGYGFETTRKR